MSIANVWIRPTEGAIAVDSAVHADDGEAGRISKVLMFPHIATAIAFRGSVLWGLHYFAILFSSNFRTFDNMRAYMLYAARAAHLGTEKNAHLLSRPWLADQQEAIAVGWSDAEQRVRGIGVRKASKGAEFEVVEIPPEGGTWFAPADHPDIRKLEKPGSVDNVQDVLAFMRAQADVYRSLAGDDPVVRAGVGGDVIVAKVRRGYVSTFQLGSI